MGPLGSSCPADIHCKYTGTIWRPGQTLADFEDLEWSLIGLDQWGLCIALLHFLQWHGVLWGYVEDKQDPMGWPLTDSQSRVMQLPRSLDRGWKYLAPSFLGPFPPTATTVRPPLKEMCCDLSKEMWWSSPNPHMDLTHALQGPASNSWLLWKPFGLRWVLFRLGFNFV